SPTADPPGYVLESDPEEEPEEDDEDPEEDLADYPANRDDDDEEEEEPFGDDADDEDEDEDEDEEEEEEHPALADSVPPVHCMTAKISIQDEPSISLPPREGVPSFLPLDRPVHRRLAVMIEREAKMVREAWGLSMDASDYARSDVMSLRTTVVAQSVTSENFRIFE
ncbi:hypothetical protein Tco_0264144, partial [Tanacetum coccineum]